MQQNQEASSMHITVLGEHGQPLRELMGSQEQVALNLPDGANFVEGPPAGDWWDGARWHDKPQQPSIHHQWAWAEYEWQDMRTAEQKDAQAWEKVRGLRDALLTATDWRVIKAQETGLPLDSAWVAYRQALRDITQQPDPQNIVWPEVPAEGSQ